MGVDEPEDLKDRSGYRRWDHMVHVLRPGGPCGFRQEQLHRCGPGRVNPSQGRPNVVFIMSDNHGAWRPEAGARPNI